LIEAGVQVPHRKPMQRSGFLSHSFRHLFRLMAAIGFLWTIVTLTPLDYWWATQLSGAWNNPKGDVLAVPAGSVLGDGTLGENSYWRAVYAARAFREQNFRRIVLSGKDAAAPMREFLVSQGIPAGVIEVENRSNSTWENALYTKEMLAGEHGRIVLLTSDYHMYRARRCYQKAGLTVFPQPFPDIRKRTGSWRGRWPAFIELVHETVKIGYYCARGWI